MQTAVFVLMHCSIYTVAQSIQTFRVLFLSVPHMNVGSSLSSVTSSNRVFICQHSFSSISVYQPDSDMYKAALSASWWTGEPVEPLTVLVSFILCPETRTSVGNKWDNVLHLVSSLLFSRLCGVLCSAGVLLSVEFCTLNTRRPLKMHRIRSLITSHHSCCDEVTLFWAASTWCKWDIGVTNWPKKCGKKGGSAEKHISVNVMLI